MQALQMIILNVERHAFGKLERLGALLLMESQSRRGLIENYHPQHGWLIFVVSLILLFFLHKALRAFWRERIIS